MFSSKLKQLRKNRYITQKDLATIIGVDRTSIGKYETSNVIPSPDVLKKLAEYFNVTTDYLLDHETSGITISEEKTPADLKKILEEQQVLFDGECMTEAEKLSIKNVLELIYCKSREHSKSKKLVCEEGAVIFKLL